MHVIAVGVNHKTAPLEVREKLALGRKQSKEALTSLFDYMPEGIILSTCNRTEVYTLCRNGCSEVSGIERFLTLVGNMSTADLKPYLYEFNHDDAIRYLFRVASGLESQVLGEYEVLGQIGNALEDAENTGMVSMPLLSLFRQAVKVGRRARQETGISKHPVSVSSVAVDLARKACGDITNSDVLVISAGEASRLVVKALRGYGISNITVASRSHDRAMSLAAAHDGKAVSLQDLTEPLTAADIVVSCSGAPHNIIHARSVMEAMRCRPHRPLVLIDIAVPRDIDPDAGDLANVHLYNIDDLKSVSGLNHRLRERERAKALQIIDDEADKFISWWKSLNAVPIIASLVSKAEKIRAEQTERTLLNMQISDNDRAAIDAMTHTIVKKLLHDPIQYLKNGDNGNNHVQAVQELFDLP